MAPSVNVTVPSATAPSALVTLAVKATGRPSVDGLRLELSAVVVAAGLTVCPRLPLLGAKFVAPL